VVGVIEFDHSGEQDHAAVRQRKSAVAVRQPGRRLAE